MAEDLANKVANLAARRGIIFPNSEIYGGVAGFFDFGGYGAEMKRNLESAWWKHFVTERQDVVGMDGAIITSPRVWMASGHTEAFNDPLVECEKCGAKHRADHLVEDALKISVDGLSIDKLSELITKHKIACPKDKGQLKIARMFNLMFKTEVGAKGGEDNTAYLRPETAQLIFTDFKRVQASSRKALPFGIAQIGKAFRNEISPRNFVFRCREFSQMEIEYFVHPKKLNDCPVLAGHLEQSALFVTEEDQKKDGKGRKITLRQALDNHVVKTRWHAYWIGECLSWLEGIGLNPTKLRVRQHISTELSHYSSETWDIEYDYPWGWKELQGIANRSDFDLKQHAAHSGQDLSYFDEESKEKVIPFVIEPSIGVERLLFTLLLDAYEEKTDAKGSTIVLNLHPAVAPVQLGILPLMKKDGMREKALCVLESLQGNVTCEYDESGSIGKRYARNDEVGVPYCLTVDYDTLKDDTVTVRERGSGRQIRVSLQAVAKTIRGLVEGKLSFEDAGSLL
ncbi:glycine--tRNA ligase [Candidatus Micrarchaeota archaeon CG1_02_55_22]|nr:MAG: glycine--tRNA ligase [Candidatus Micrarchaeota archaeon CG1_02_55_22]